MRACAAAVLVALLGLGGCFVADTAELVTPAEPVEDEEITASYDNIMTGHSGVADVLLAIHRPESEELSQSTSVIASAGQNKRKHKMWFNMVAFDETAMTAGRKYLFIVDERPKQLSIDRWTGVRFDCQVVMDKSVLDKAYPDNDAMRIAVLKDVQKKFRGDLDEVRLDNKRLAISGMMVNQIFETVLVKLADSPVLAGRLSDFAGLEFDHTSLGRGKIGMTIFEGIVTVKVRAGSFTKEFEETY